MKHPNIKFHENMITCGQVGRQAGSRSVWASRRAGGQAGWRRGRRAGGLEAGGGRASGGRAGGGRLAAGGRAGIHNGADMRFSRVLKAREK